MNRCTCKIILRKEKASTKTGKAPLAIQFFINGVKKVKALNIYIEPENFDENKEAIKSKTDEARDLQLIIDNAKAKTTQIFTEYRLKDTLLSAEKFLELFEDRSSNTDFLLFYKAEMNKRLANNAISQSTWKQNKTTLVKLKEFRSQILFKDIDKSFIQEFDNWHRKKLLKKAQENGIPLIKEGINTRWHAQKNIRTYLNIAIEEGIKVKDPFKTLKIVRTDGERVFLLEDEVSRLANLYKSKQLPPSLQRHLLRFMISVFTGLRVSDSKSVTEFHIQDNQLIFTPQKTERRGKLHKIPLSKAAKYFIDELKKDTYYKPVSDQDYNRELKKIAAFAQIYKKVTSHTGRHTFGHLFLKQGGKVEVLKELMGHSDIRTTMIYVHLTDETKQQQVFNMDKLISIKTKK